MDGLATNDQVVTLSQVVTRRARVADEPACPDCGRRDSHSHDLGVTASTQDGSVRLLQKAQGETAMSFRIAVVHKDDDSGDDVVYQAGNTFDSAEDADSKKSAALAEAKATYKDASVRVEQLVIDRDDQTGEALSAEWVEVTE